MPGPERSGWFLEAPHRRPTRPLRGRCLYGVGVSRGAPLPASTGLYRSTGIYRRLTVYRAVGRPEPVPTGPRPRPCPPRGASTGLYRCRPTADIYRPRGEGLCRFLRCPRRNEDPAPPAATIPDRWGVPLSRAGSRHHPGAVAAAPLRILCAFFRDRLDRLGGGSRSLEACALLGTGSRPTGPASGSASPPYPGPVAGTRGDRSASCSGARGRRQRRGGVPARASVPRGAGRPRRCVAAPRRARRPPSVPPPGLLPPERSTRGRVPGVPHRNRGARRHAAT